MNMTRKAAAFLLALCLFVACSGVSFAAFDYSVFEQNEAFKVDMFEDGTMGFISFASADEWPMYHLDEAEVRMSIFIQDTSLGYPSFIDFSIPTYNRINDFGIITLLPDMTGYTVTALADYRGVHFEILPAMFPMIEEIIDKNISSVKYKLSGDGYCPREGIAHMNVGDLKLFYELYKTAGGLEQDFTIIEKDFPVTID